VQLIVEKGAVRAFVNSKLIGESAMGNPQLNRDTPVMIGNWHRWNRPFHGTIEYIRIS